MQTKQALRQSMLRMRSQQSQTLRALYSNNAQEQLLANKIFQNAQNIAVYIAKSDEVDTSTIITAAMADNKNVFLPRVLDLKQGQMEFVPYSSNMELKKSKIGILEPSAHYAGFLATSTRDFHPDLAIIPGLAFTLDGARLGFGGGFYDRFLAHHSTCLRVGLCFAFQIIDALPMNAWDQKMQFLCTENAFYDLENSCKP